MTLTQRKDPKIELLGRVELFQECSSRQLARIAALADVVEVEAGAALTQEGRVGHEAFVIADGRATVEIGGRVVGVVEAGDVVGEMALLDHGPRVATVTAETRMKLFVLDARSFASLLVETPAVAQAIMRTVAVRLREAEAGPF